ncbi:hypothetical protein FCULG_00000590, partial [Fusarium culmorum]
CKNGAASPCGWLLQPSSSLICFIARDGFIKTWRKLTSAVVRFTGDFAGRYGDLRALASAPPSCITSDHSNFSSLEVVPVFAPHASDLPPGLDRACHEKEAGRRNSAKGFEMETNSQKRTPEDLFKDMFASVYPSTTLLLYCGPHLALEQHVPTLSERHLAWPPLGRTKEAVQYYSCMPFLALHGPSAGLHQNALLSQVTRCAAGLHKPGFI